MGSELVVDALAAYRLTRLIVEDTILDEPRSRLVAWLDPPYRLTRNGCGEVVHSADPAPFPGARKLAEGLGCQWCVGIWTAAAVIGARRSAPGSWAPIADMLAAATIAGLLAERA